MKNYSVMKLLIAFTLSSVTVSVLASSMTAEQCDKLWHENASVKDSAEGLDTLLTKWQEAGGKCKGTGIYEVRLTSIYAMLGNYDLARQSLAGITVPPKYQAQAEYILINNSFMEVLSNGAKDAKVLKEVESQAISTLSKYPEQVMLNGLLGHLRVLLGNYSGAIEPLEKAVRLPGGDMSVGSYRNLAIVYEKVAKYEEALGAGDKAYSISKNISSDEKFMYSMAVSYAAVGNIDAAKSMLTLILNKKPELQNDVQFRQTVQKAKELSGGKLK